MEDERMRLQRIAHAGLLALSVASAAAPAAWAQNLNFRAVAPARREAFSDPIPITVGRPQAANSAAAPRSLEPVFRAQMGPDSTPPITVPPPPAFPGTIGGTAPPPTSPLSTPSGKAPKMKPNEEEYNCGRVNSDADTGGFFTRTGDQLGRCWTDLTDGGWAGGAGRSMFQSDTAFPVFISPVTNPFLFEDPRALTEIRPIFMWQKTPSSNYIYQGNSNYFATLQGRVAITQNISLVVNRLGWAWSDPVANTQGVANGSGFSELNIGPKFTFIREEASNTVGALGLNFILPIGSGSANQNTGDLALAPYFSIAQNFGKSDYGSFNFMNTTGYSFSTDNQRTDFLYSSFHLDYDYGNAKKFYPLVELNWFYYAFNGGARPTNFEGSSLTNFGSTNVSGQNDLNLALGARYKVSENIQFGLAGEMNILGGGRHMDLFRLTADFILRY
jgi:hypothetical protein